MITLFSKISKKEKINKKGFTYRTVKYMLRLLEDMKKDDTNTAARQEWFLELHKCLGFCDRVNSGKHKETLVERFGFDPDKLVHRNSVSDDRLEEFYHARDEIEERADKFLQAAFKLIFEHREEF